MIDTTPRQLLSNSREYQIGKTTYLAYKNAPDSYFLYGENHRRIMNGRDKDFPTLEACSAMVAMLVNGSTSGKINLGNYSATLATVRRPGALPANWKQQVARLVPRVNQGSSDVCQRVYDNYLYDEEILGAMHQISTSYTLSLTQRTAKQLSLL